MATIELAKSTDGRETLLRVRNARSFPDQPHIKISWIATNKMLGPRGWENAAYLIRARSVRDKKDLIIRLDAGVTNHILPGTPVEITIRELDNLSDKLVWPAQIPGTIPIGAGTGPIVSGEPEDRKDRESSEQSSPEPQRIAGGHDAQPAWATGRKPALQDEITQIVDEPPTPQTEPRTDWRKIAAACVAGLLIGMGLGAGGKYGYDAWVTTGEPTTIAQFQRDIARLRTEAFAPLAHDVVQVADRSPKGKTPDEVAGEGAPPGMVEERALKFLDHGLEMARSGDVAEATYWYRQALRLCQADSMFYLGDAYLSGAGAPKDMRTGFQLMRTSSAMGSQRATDHVRAVLQRQDISLAPATMGDLYQRR